MKTFMIAAMFLIVPFAYGADCESGKCSVPRKTVTVNKEVVTSQPKVCNRVVGKVSRVRHRCRCRCR